LTVKPYIDSNIFMDYSKELLEEFDHIYLPGYVAGELDNLRHNGKSEEAKYQARRASRDIDANEDKITYIINETSCDNLPSHYDKDNMDNKIISVLIDLYAKDKDFIAYSNDILFRQKCKELKIPYKKYGDKSKNDGTYLGHKNLSGDTNFINNLFDNVNKEITEHSFVANEYLILNNTDTNKTSEHRFDGYKFVDLRLPNSKVIKGMNPLQRCALDLLNNKSIPIKIIAGGFGSGKTILSVKVGLDMVVAKEDYKTLLFLRNPVPSDGADIGFLPGDKAEKIADYCRPFLQYIEDPKNQFYSENLIRDEKIKMDVTTFLKGVSIDDSFVIMDEAEDLNTKLIKLVGSRIGKTSCVVFTGDCKQSESKYKQDNGLMKLIKCGKGNPLVGIVVLEDDLRSDASKVFAEM